MHILCPGWSDTAWASEPPDYFLMGSLVPATSIVLPRYDYHRHGHLYNYNTPRKFHMDGRF